MPKTIKDNRIEIIRIVAILLVVLLHVTNRFLLTGFNKKDINSIVLIFVNSITRISVPLFFMISGIVNIPKAFDKRKYYSRILRMIIILIVWTLIYYFVGNYKFSFLLHSMFSSLKPHLWYMYAIIGLYIATPFVSKMVNNLDKNEEKLFIRLWVLFSGIYYLIIVVLGLLKVDTTVTHPIPIFNATYYLGYYIAGHLIYKNLDKKHINIARSSIIAVVCFATNAILTTIVSMKNNSYYQGFFGYSNILIIIPSVLFLRVFLMKITNKEYRLVRLVCPCIFGIFLSHIIILDLLLKFINIPGQIINCIMYTIATFVISYLLTFVIKKIPYVGKYIC